MALRSLAGFATIHIDNDEVLHGMERGRAYCTGASNKYAHIWRLVWAKIDDIGCASIGDAFKLESVKAHCT
eukprot:5400099-Karenia_brevis.AAC.1